jgi:ABC-type nitrate/sulfonate/bicarbonate transport system permease component
MIGVGTQAPPGPLVRTAYGIAGLVLLGLVWHLVTAAALVPRVFLPSPLATWAALQRGFTSGELAAQFFATVNRMLVGWLLASAIGIAIGSLIGQSAVARRTLGPTLAFVRALPASATLPIAIAFAGLSPGMVLGVVAFGSLWPTLFATVQGFAMVDPRLVEVARSLHLSRVQFILKIGLPNAMADILTGMRLSMTVALILSVIGEMLAAQPGLGQAILLAARAFRAPDLYAGILLLGVVGIGSMLIITALERRFLRWR